MQKFIAALGAVAAILIVIVVGVTFVLSPVSGSSPAARTVNLTENANGTTVSIHIGDELRITLGENPSTGYGWNYTVPEAFSVTMDRYTAPEGSGMVGQSGSHTWLLKAEQKGTYEITWMYKRSWESTASDRPFTIKVVIE
ncbi:MAG: protease inhibitor I42 family protein [Methanomicrobiales archaeon]|nr:protease inhibitor I42 family protein [Methanomicrobiales archaeon]